MNAVQALPRKQIGYAKQKIKLKTKMSVNKKKKNPKSKNI